MLNSFKRRNLSVVTSMKFHRFVPLLWSSWSLLTNFQSILVNLQFASMLSLSFQNTSGYWKILFRRWRHFASVGAGLRGNINLLGKFRYSTLRIEKSCKLNHNHSLASNARTRERQEPFYRQRGTYGWCNFFEFCPSKSLFLIKFGNTLSICDFHTILISSIHFIWIRVASKWN